jgi:hypothetical protein
VSSKDHPTFSWSFEFPDNVVKNTALSEQLLEHAMRKSIFDELDFPQLPPLTGWAWVRARARNFWAEWRPTFHFGPCDHSECE